MRRARCQASYRRLLRYGIPTIVLSGILQLVPLRSLTAQHLDSPLAGYVAGIAPSPGGLPTTGRRLLHDDHERFSKYLVDPLFTHHAILEDELRVNTFFDSRRDGSSVWHTSLEVAYAFTDALGAEIFLPWVRVEPAGLPQDARSAVADLEVQPLKWSFLRERDLILTAVLGAVIPTDEAEDEVGERRWALEPHFFVDAVLGTVAVQGNLIYGFVEGGEQEFEFSASFARPIYFGERFAVGPLLEVMGGASPGAPIPGAGTSRSSAWLRD